MKILRTSRQVDSFLKTLKKRSTGGSPKIEQAVHRILDDVRKNGDAAVRKYTKKYDDLAADHVRISGDEIDRHAKKADKQVVQSLKISAKRIRAFHARQKEKSWAFSSEGALLGQIIRPIERVGVYIPGGKASYPSTALMNVIPAQVAGVRHARPPFHGTGSLPDLGTEILLAELVPVGLVDESDSARIYHRRACVACQFEVRVRGVAVHREHRLRVDELAFVRVLQPYALRRYDREPRVAGDNYRLFRRRNG